MLDAVCEPLTDRKLDIRGRIAPEPSGRERQNRAPDFARMCPMVAETVRPLLDDHRVFVASEPIALPEEASRVFGSRIVTCPRVCVMILSRLNSRATSLIPARRTPIINDKNSWVRGKLFSSGAVSGHQRLAGHAFSQRMESIARG